MGYPGITLEKLERLSILSFAEFGGFRSSSIVVNRRLGVVGCCRRIAFSAIQRMRGFQRKRAATSPPLVQISRLEVLLRLLQRQDCQSQHADAGQQQGGGLGHPGGGADQFELPGG